MKASDTNDFHLAQTSPFPLGIAVSSAEGNYIIDTNGKKYLDLIAGIGVSYLGHGNSAVIEAIRLQSEKHLHVMVYGEFDQEAPQNLAAELKPTLAPSLNAFYFVNSGTEAIEAALKLVKRATNRHQVIAFEGSYHGSTHGSLSLSNRELKKNPFRPLLPGVSFIRLNNRQDLEHITEETAAIFLETIQGDAGVRIPEKDYLKALREKCTKTGTLLVLDEIQCGMGRTGKMWAYEHFDIIPDILVSGKALGAGLPIGALICKGELMKKFSKNPMLGHITTFGGHPLPAAAGAAGLKFLKKHSILNQVEQKGKRFVAQLKHPKIKSIRQIGLFIAVDLDQEETVNQLVLEGLKEGIILFWFLGTPKSFRIAPPLTISEKEIDFACATICQLLDRI